MNEIKDIINSIFPLSESALKKIVGLIEYKGYRAGYCFIEKGRRNHYEYFLIDGVCRSYLLSPEGIDITIAYYKSKSVLSPFVTRTNNCISNLNFQALTELRLGLLDSSEFEDLMVNNLQIREFGNAVLKMELQKKTEKEIWMASLTAKERLLKFREQFPGLENQVPHYTIATFLGITNVSLSRLRRNLIGE